MHDVSFDEALEFIQLIDSRYHREAYTFVREALDYTQQRVEKSGRVRSHHVTGQELLAGIRGLALQKFGPMAAMVLQEWGVKCCPDFGEIVFNMVELGGSPAFSADDLKELNGFMERVKQASEPVSQLIWNSFSESARHGLQANTPAERLAEILATELNRIIVSGPIYDQQRFASVALSLPVKCLVRHKLKGGHLVRLNRLLLEDAYPVELAKSHGVLAKTEQDSRADFRDGYDFYEAFQKPFLPKNKLTRQNTNTPAPSSL